MLRDGYRDFISYLNEILENDPSLMEALLKTEYVCNEWTALHPSIQVFSKEHAKERLGTDGDDYIVRFLGIVNGFFGTFDDGPCKGFGPIAVAFNDETGEIIGFSEFVNERKHT
jgi:hypothetical protein